MTPAGRSLLYYVLKPFNLPMRDICHGSEGLAATYDAPGWITDRIVCVLVRFGQQALSEPVSLGLTATMVSTATTAYAIMSVEGARTDLSLAPLMILLGNIFGTGIIAPLVWLPLWAYFSKKYTSAIGTDRVVGIATGAVLGQLLPSVLPMVLHHRAHRNALAVLQYFPVGYGLLEHSFGWLRLPQRQDAVQLLYVGLAGINTLLFYSLVASSLWLGIPWKSQLVHIALHGTSPGDAVSYMLIWDIVALVGTFGYWIWLETSWRGVVQLLGFSMIFGPGAGLAMSAWKRETMLETKDKQKVE
ncbi:hypothetical protein DFQ28_001380 [Apophysomyces sp. BC1034]|nr:hypothetical protein DFQ28_001380 [Apophysomyces sp. BC1034]